MTSKRVRRILTTVLSSAFLLGGVLVAGTGVASARTATLFVSPSGTPLNDGFSCATAKYSKIQSAVNAAAPWRGTVVVCKGTYAEDVVVSHPLTLLGLSAVIQGVGTTQSELPLRLGWAAGRRAMPRRGDHQELAR